MASAIKNIDQAGSSALWHDQHSRRLNVMTTKPSVTSLMVRFAKVADHELKARDVLVLWVVIENPGIMGQDAARKLGIINRSTIQAGIDRLILQGLIEDRRVEKRRTCPNVLHATNEGRTFFDELVS